MKHTIFISRFKLYGNCISSTLQFSQFAALMYGWTNNNSVHPVPQFTPVFPISRKSPTPSKLQKTNILSNIYT